MHSHRSNSSDTRIFSCLALAVLAAQPGLARAQDVGLEQAADLRQVITSAKSFDEIAAKRHSKTGIRGTQYESNGWCYGLGPHGREYREANWAAPLAVNAPTSDQRLNKTHI